MNRPPVFFAIQHVGERMDKTLELMTAMTESKRFLGTIIFLP